MKPTSTTQFSVQHQTDDARLNELEEENELLFSQLHVVQEALERFLTESSDKDVRLVTTQAMVWVDDALPEALAENMRLQAALDVRKLVHVAESLGALNVRLGDILIQGVTSPASLLSLPGKLRRVWRESKQQTPPAALGGKSFDKVIATYRAGGLAAVELLLTSASVSPAMQANALTVLARSLMQDDSGAAAEAAHQAFSIDPRPFRLKWLAFRLHETGDANQAEAMLDALPADMQFSDSETRQASRLRNEARQVRLCEARQKTGYAERRAEMERQMVTLVQARDELTKVAAGRAHEVEALKAAKTRLELEKSAVAARHDEQRKLAEERAREVEALKAAKTRLELEKSAVAARHDEQRTLAEERAREVEALKAAKTQLELEKSAVATRHDEQTKLAEEHAREIEALKAAKTRLELEKSAVETRHDEQRKLAEEHAREIEALKAAKTQLELEKSAVATRHDEQTKLAEGRAREVEALKAAKTRLELEKSAVETRHDEQRKLAEERAREIEAITAVKAQLELEKSALATRLEELARLAGERQKQVDESQRQFLVCQNAEADLTARNQAMREELARAEAQLDLIKQMLLGQRRK